MSVESFIQDLLTQAKYRVIWVSFDILNHDVIKRLFTQVQR